jgi:hypothetical protein
MASLKRTADPSGVPEGGAIVGMTVWASYGGVENPAPPALLFAVPWMRRNPTKSTQPFGISDFKKGKGRIKGKGFTTENTENDREHGDF